MIIAVPLGPREWLDEARDTILHVRSKMERGDELVVLVDRYTLLPPGFLAWAMRQADRVIVSRFPFGIGDVRNAALERALSERECVLFADAHVLLYGDVHKMCDVKVGVPWRIYAKGAGPARLSSYVVYLAPAYEPTRWIQISEPVEFFAHDNPVYSVTPEAIEVVKEHLSYFPPFFFREISAVLLSIYRLSGMASRPVAGVEAAHRFRTAAEFVRRNELKCGGHEICGRPNPYSYAGTQNILMYKVLHLGDNHDVLFKEKLVELRRRFKEDLKDLYSRFRLTF